MAINDYREKDGVFLISPTEDGGYRVVWNVYKPYPRDEICTTKNQQTAKELADALNRQRQ